MPWTLKYEPLTCLKNFLLTVLKLWFFKSIFHRIKNALTPYPWPQLNLIPGAGLIHLIDTRYTHARGSSSAAGPFVVCGTGPPHLIRVCPQSSFFRVDPLKKLARTAYKFNRGPEQRVKAILLWKNVDLKNRSFKTVDQKIFKQVSGS
jgi:hypothetical protein